MKSFSEKVWEKCREIPKGKVTTYKELAHAIGTKAYRAVGTALKKNPYAPGVPCHRVVASDGDICGYQGKHHNCKKAQMLEKEGVKVKDYHIVEFEKRVYNFKKIK
jgi:O-6-methylguanine DNA methyltransferase